MNENIIKVFTAIEVDLSASLQAGRELLQACEQLLACKEVDLEGWRYLRQVDEFIETVEAYRRFYEEQASDD